MEAEVQMVRTITHCESELTFLLGQIDKAANKQSGITATATKELQQAWSKKGLYDSGFMTKWFGFDPEAKTFSKLKDGKPTVFSYKLANSTR